MGNPNLVRKPAIDSSSVGEVSPAQIATLNPAYKNYIINGNFDFWQRGSTFTNTVNVYTADRWYAWFNSGDITRQAISDLPGSEFALRIVARAGSLEANMLQALESKTVKPLIGKLMTLSFYARKGSAFDGEFRVYIGTNTASEAKTPQAGELYAGILNLAPSLTTSWQKFTVTTTVAVPSNTLGVTVSFRHNAVVSGGSNNYFELAQVMLNEGAAASPFSLFALNHVGELTACQRYYQRISFGNNTYSAQFSFNTFYGHSVSYSPMRALSSTSYLHDGGNWYWVHVGITAFSGNDSSAVTVVANGSSLKIVQTRIPGNSVPTTGSLYVLEASWTAVLDAEL